jgi:hypothetical protein
MITGSLCLRGASYTRPLNPRTVAITSRVRSIHSSPSIFEEAKPFKRETIAPPKTFNNGIQSNRTQFLNALKKDLGDSELPISSPVRVQLTSRLCRDSDRDEASPRLAEEHAGVEIMDTQRDAP